MKHRGILFAATLVAALVLAGPAAGAASGPSTTAGQTMFEGKVLTASATSITVETPARGFYCGYGGACPDLIAMGKTYTVLTTGAAIFGSYLNTSVSMLRPGAEVVVYGRNLPAPAQSGPGGLAPVLFGGLVQAEGIFVLTPVPLPCVRTSTGAIHCVPISVPPMMPPVGHSNPVLPPRHVGPTPMPLTQP